MPPYNGHVTTTETLPTLSNDAALSLLTEFTVSYRRSISLSFQGWKFEHSHTVEFLPSHSPDDKRALIRKMSEIVRIVVLQDIVATLPEIEATVGDQPAVIETLKRSLGLA